MLSRRTRMVLAVLIVASLTFIILDLRGGQGPLGGLRSFGANIIGDLERVAATVFSPVTGASSWWSDMRDQAAQIQTLRSENSTLRGDLTTLQSDKARADALDALLRVSSVGDYRFVPAEVVAVGPAQDFAWTVTVDAGRNDGVENDMSVINGDGLVGHVVKTTSGTATVMLVTDAESSVGARIAGSEEIGVVSGTGDLVLGLSLMLAFGLGMGVLFFVLGVSTALVSRRPRSGAWMERVEITFAVALLVVALYYARLGLGL